MTGPVTGNARPDGSGGRGRSPKLDAAITEATLRLLGRHGAHFSLEAVAREVGCSKSSIYRRYGSSVGLISGVTRTLFDKMVSDDRNGLIHDIVLSRAHSLVEPATLVALLALMAESARETEIGQGFKETIYAPIRRGRIELLTGAVERGELRADADLDLVLDVISGTLILRAALTGGIEEGLPERLLALILDGVGGPCGRTTVA